MAIFKDETLSFQDLDASKVTVLKKLSYRTAAVDPASIAAASSLETAVTLRGLSVGDMVEVGVPAALETGLAFSGVRVSAADTLQLRLTNVTGLAVDGASRTWEFLIWDLTP